MQKRHCLAQARSQNFAMGGGSIIIFSLALASSVIVLYSYG